MRGIERGREERGEGGNERLMMESGKAEGGKTENGGWKGGRTEEW